MKSALTRILIVALISTSMACGHKAPPKPPPDKKPPAPAQAPDAKPPVTDTKPPAKE